MKIMSNSPENMEAGCRKSGKLPEKSNFNQTCSLLSQYLKEKRGFGNLNLEMIRKLEAEASKGKSEMFKRPQEATTTTTMDLLPNIEKPAAAAAGGGGGGGEIWRQNGAESSSPIVKSSDLLPNFAGLGSSDSVEDAIRKADFSKSTTTDPETAQMTIFYAGKVLVFDDFPSDKAKLVMLLASSLNSTNSSVGCDRIINSGCPVSSSSKAVSTPTTDPPMHQPQTKGSVIPIARRTSLHRFLSKRKDRVVTKAPYQVNNRSSSAPKPEENMKSLMYVDLEAQTSNQLELKL